jgi:hypothetical protein
MKNITFTDSKNRKWDYQIPFLITCNATGTVKTYTSEEYINRKIERFNGLDNLRATYICRDAKRAGKTIKVEPAPEEVKPNLFQEILDKQPLALPAPKPVAKQDKNGKYRNAKGHLIAKDKLGEYELVEYTAKAA